MTFTTNLDRWRYYCKDFESPDLFIDWTFYGMIAASLQRRVSVSGVPASHSAAPGNIYPNMYMVFIADPGIGKSIAANQAKYLFSSMDTFNKDGKLQEVIKRGPDSVTLEALTRYLNNHYTATPMPEEIAGGKGKIYTHSSLAMFCGDELGTLLRENTNDLVIFLNQGWDCGDFHRETKTQGVDLIKNMCITMIGAATPSWVKEVVSSRLLNEGFSARTIFVFGEKKRFNKFDIVVSADQVAERMKIRDHVAKLTKLFGEIKQTAEVREWCRDWYENKHKAINPHRALKDYYARKKIHLVKLATCIHFADSTTMELTVQDYERALDMLEKTELQMDRAISSAGANPIYSIASGILDYLSKKEGEREYEKQIIADFFNEGDMDQITQAFEFIQKIGKARTTNVGGRLVWSLTPKQEQVDL